MRLPTIQEELKKPFISFEEYFQNYVFEVQDRNIDGEMKFFVQHNFISPKTLAKIMDQTGKDLRLL